MHYIHGATIGNSSGGNLGITMRYLTFNFLSNKSSKYTSIRDIMIDLSRYGSIHINASGHIAAVAVGYSTIRYGSLCALYIHDSTINPIFTYTDSTNSYHIISDSYGNITLSNLAQNAVTDTVISLYNNI